VRWNDVTDIEIYNNDLGKPEIRLFGKVKQKADELGISSIFVSITHLKDLANAVVVLEAN